jgi:tRNA threonylcarbamoyladenosine biosynthesis protein TsaB
MTRVHWSDPEAPWKRKRRQVMSATPEWTEAVLAIDTSSPQGAVVLYDGHQISTRSWPAGRSHTTTLLAEIHHLLDTAGTEIASLAAIGVAVGPGTFTGLRVGLGVAKGFHLAVGTPLLGISTLEATALPFVGCGRNLIPVVAAGRGRLIWTPYSTDDEGLTALDLPRNGTVAELVEALSKFGPTIVCGELGDEDAALVQSLPETIVPPLPIRLRQPGAFAALTRTRWQRGETDDATSIEPIYLSR